MSSSEQFHGDQLRLTSFLAVINRIPQRSQRRGWRCFSVLEPDRKAATPVSSLLRGNADARRPNETLACESPIEIVEVHSNPFEDFSATESNHTVEDPQETALTFSHSFHGDGDIPLIQADTPSPTSRNCIQKRKARQVADISQSNDALAQTRRTIVHELSLVRTLTNDDLVEHHGDARSPVVPIEEVDPIEDSQTISDIKLSKSRLNCAVKPSKVLQRARIKGVKSPEQPANTRTRRRYFENSQEISDGFSPAELHSEPHFATKVVARRTRLRRGKLPPADVPIRELTLVAGACPSPPSPESVVLRSDFVGTFQSLDSTGHHSSTSSLAPDINMEMVHCSPTPSKTMITSTASKQVSLQLSRITAPERAESDSGTEYSQAGSFMSSNVEELE
ncbi:hypothetical protein BU24DRAFT_489896 [Aaosphaeria arxii CBS 175.79]|uniref:Uncharacterized protein n=1 Tax=Aaosphaeria arxii CBS 175.79 TaxID=1450172 RepID=A0A6A5Y471_9PLEO|nr:uncharacterized protein BU24DRAFT_489896 [Aaosphaeria arxii CBS 175.79]KAF2020056.1 hypothetical protein BU24DRAFT_489896 [Aaosphaeria arxii CBS 175.79]